jgi:uncharacterized protein (DUF58 family)
MSRQAAEPERILQRLDWTIIRRLDGILQGDYRTLFRGFGMELAELREYQLTDDVRSIDWYVTARLQTPYVRQYMEDREITAWFLLDMSPSVDFGTITTLKRSLLVDFTAVLARLLTRHGNRVGALIFTGRKTRFIPARGGRIHVLRMIKDVLGEPRLTHSPSTDLSLLLAGALGLMRRRSLVFIVSDFISVPGWERALSVMTQRHEVLAVRLFDPREIELPDIGPAVFQDAETGEQLYLDTHDRGFRRRFAESARVRREELSAVFAEAGVDLLSLSTEGDLVAELARFAIERKQRKALPQSRPARAAVKGST